MRSIFPPTHGNGSHTHWSQSVREHESNCDRNNDLKPLVIHSNYLVNLAGGNAAFLKKSISAFRGELERGLALCAEYLVLHPGSFRGGTEKRV